MQTNTRKLTRIAMLSAIAYVVMLVARFPVVMFLKYEPKDVVITLGGLLWGPMTSVAVSVNRILSGDVLGQRDGHPGLCHEHRVLLFLCLHRSAGVQKAPQPERCAGRAGFGQRGHGGADDAVELPDHPALHGLPPGGGGAAAAPRLPALQPAESRSEYGITFFLYKPVSDALRKSGLLERPGHTAAAKSRPTGLYLFFGFLLVSCVLLVLVMNGVI